MVSVLLTLTVILWLAGRMKTPTGAALLDRWMDQLAALSVTRALAIVAAAAFIVLAASVGAAELPLLLSLDLTALLDALFAVWLIASGRRFGIGAAGVRRGLRRIVEAARRLSPVRRTARDTDRSPPAEAASPAANDDAEDDPAERLAA